MTTRYLLVIEKINGQNTEPSQYAVREFENDITAMKEFRTQTRQDLLKLYNSVNCSIYKCNGSKIKIFSFGEQRELQKANIVKFLNRVDFK